eukprot:354173-Chlamydomonas_euryale.AAC.2
MEVEFKKQRGAVDAEQAEHQEEADMLARCKCVARREAAQVCPTLNNMRVGMPRNVASKWAAHEKLMWSKLPSSFHGMPGRPKRRSMKRQCI